MSTRPVGRSIVLDGGRVMNINLTEEGVIIDVYHGDETEPQATFSNTYEELADLIEERDPLSP